jgi:hypothetical protein
LELDSQRPKEVDHESHYLSVFSKYVDQIANIFKEYACIVLDLPVFCEKQQMQNGDDVIFGHRPFEGYTNVLVANFVLYSGEQLYIIKRIQE